MEKEQPFSEAIKAARSKAGLSLQQSANRIGITKAHLWELERGSACNPTARTLGGLGTAYGVAPSTLLKLAVAQITAQHEEGGA